MSNDVRRLLKQEEQEEGKQLKLLLDEWNEKRKKV